MSGPLIRFVTGSHFEAILQVTRNGTAVAIDTGATVKAVIRDDGEALTSEVTCSYQTTDADWPNGIVVAVFPSAVTRAIPFSETRWQRRCQVELQVVDMVETRWLQDGYLAIKGLIS